MAAKRLQPPTGLSTAGKALWRRVLGDLAPGWELDARDLALLAEAAKLADELALLEKGIKQMGAVVEGSMKQPRPNPLMAEARAHRLAIQKLLAGLVLEDPAIARAAMSPASRRASDAAAVRWQGARRRGEIA
jgi:hypothetical protein